MKQLLEAVIGRTVSRETMEVIDLYAALLREEAQRQNLIARSTISELWQRHIADSAQLVRFAPQCDAAWVDVGSGPGLPGIVVAALTNGPVTLIEPRRLRSEFLVRTVEALGLADRVTVAPSKVENVEGRFDVITGRAVAALDHFLSLSHHLSTRNSLWVLPKGRSAQSELAEARRKWHCEARAEPSRTDPDAEILVLTGVGMKKR